MWDMLMDDSDLKLLLWVIAGLIVGSGIGYVVGGYFLLAWIASLLGRAEL